MLKNHLAGTLIQTGKALDKRQIHGMPIPYSPKKKQRFAVLQVEVDLTQEVLYLAT